MRDERDERDERDIPIANVSSQVPMQRTSRDSSLIWNKNQLS